MSDESPFESLRSLRSLRPQRLITTLSAAVLAFAWLACASCASRPHHPANDPRQRTTVDAARELDQEGVRVFRERRYADAIRYFRAAYVLGGPPSELWNIAKCKERMDDAAGATA